MTIRVRNSSGLIEVANVRVRDAANVLQDAGAAFIRDASATLKQFFSSFAVSLSTTLVGGKVNSASTATVVTKSVTANVEGGVGTITYSWARTDGGAHPWTINSPNSATTTFSTDVDSGTTQNATFACTVTDQGGHGDTTADVSASATNLYFGGVL